VYRRLGSLVAAVGLFTVASLGVGVVDAYAYAPSPPQVQLGSDGQALFDTATAADEAGVGVLAEGLDPELLAVGALVALLSALGLDSGTYTQQSGFLQQQVRYCIQSIQSSSDYPDWTSPEFLASTNSPTSSGVIVGPTFELQNLYVNDNPSTIDCDPVSIFPLIYSASQIASEPWQGRFCVEAMAYDGDGQFWPTSVSGLAGSNWAWLLSAGSSTVIDAAKTLAYLDEACPASWLATVFGESYTDNVAGAPVSTAPPPDASGDCSVNWSFGDPPGAYAGAGPALAFNCTETVNPVSQGYVQLSFVVDYGGTYYDEPRNLISASLVTVSGTGPYQLSGSYEVGENWGSDTILEGVSFEGDFANAGRGPETLYIVPDNSFTDNEKLVLTPGDGVTVPATDGVVANKVAPPTASPATAPQLEQAPGATDPSNAVGTSTQVAPVTGIAPEPAPAQSGVTNVSDQPDTDAITGTLATVGDDIDGGLHWLGDDITTGLGDLQTSLGDDFSYLWSDMAPALDGTLSEVTSLVGDVIALPDLVVDGILSDLEEAFEPSTTTAAEVEADVTTTFPLDWVATGVAGVGDVTSAAGTALAGSACGPYVGWSGLDVPSFGVHLPSPDPSCPGNGPGGARTAEDDEAGGLYGYRVDIRDALALFMILAFIVRLSRSAPWVADADDLAPQVDSVQ
jgi:hypothetical protein